MKRILFLLFLFALSINVILAQVATINIATPNSNGLSNNQVADFDVNSDGTILNNSATGGTAQLGNTGLAANNNITGSEADLILFQVTGTSGSGLNGAIEVFGGEAGLIIANPNGISCNGCGFINTNKVDLVTGTANFSGDDFTGFSIDGSSTLNVSGSGFLSDAVADELNLVSRNINTVAQAKANTTLRFLAGNETYDHTTNIITSNATETSGPHSIWISGDLEANYIELISTEISSGGIYGIVNHGEDISADRLKIDSNGLFRNQNDGTNVGNINISGLLEVINAERFINNANITAEILSITTNEFSNNDNGSTQLGNIVVTDTFSLSTPNASYTNTGTVSSDSLSLIIGGDFDYVADYLNNGTITTNALNLNVGGDFSYDDSANDFDWGANDTLTVSGSAFFNVYEFYNRGQIDVAKDLNVTAAGYWFSNYATISADSFNVTAGNYFFNRDGATINADNFNVTAGNYFFNRDGATINADNFNVTADYRFYNQDNATISADNFNVTAERFYNEDNATISADNFNVTAGRDFSNEDNAIINADNFNVTADYRFYNQDNATISADNFNVTAERFSNEDNATISADNFNVTAGRYFYNQDNAIINADSLNISYNSFDNKGIITDGITYYFGNVFIENVNNLSIVPDGTTLTDAIQSSSGVDIINIARPDSNGLSNNSYSDFNISSSGLVFNNSASAVSSSLAGTIAGNPNYAALDSASLILNQITSNNASYLGGMLEVAGDSAAIIIANPNGIVCDGCSFVNTDKVDLITGTANLDAAGMISDYTTTANDVFIYEANIVVNDFNAIVGDNFVNTGGNISADNFNVTGSFSNYAIINADNFNVTGSFHNSGTINADNFNVAGYSFSNNYATINANDFNVTLTGTYSEFDNSGTIDANDFDVEVEDDFYNNGGTINADNFNVTAGDEFINTGGYPIYNATINADNFNVTAGGGFRNSYSATINANNLTISAYSVADSDTRLSSGNISADTLTFSVAGDFDYAFDYQNNGNISANNQYFIAKDGDFTTNTDIVITGNLAITADNYIQSGAIDIAGDISIQVNGEASLDDNASIKARNLFFSAYDLYNQADITITENATFEIENDFFNGFRLSGIDYDGGDIIVGSFNVTAGNNFINRNNATIDADSFNVTAAGDFDNYATIDTENFNVTAVNNFNNRSYATINADSFNATTDSFFNETNSTITANECNIVATSYTDNGTITCNDEIEVIDIARPDANGLSNNSYETFHISINGIVLNNSDSAGTSQLAGDISANTNYNSGDAASLILAQITGNDISLLFGALEVFGAEAGVIIANSSGITCNGCSFINASRVDLVTGSNYNSSTDSFNDIANTNIALIDNGFDASSVGILNIQAGSFTNTGGLEANTFNLSVAGDFDYTNRGTITTTGFNLNVGGDFSNNDASNDFTWSANDSLTVLGTASVVADSFSNSGTIAVSNSSFDITATDFTNSGTISANTTLNTTVSSTVSGSFDNTGGVLNSDTFALSVAGDFDYANDFQNNGNIDATTLNFQVGGNFSYDDASNDFVWNAQNSLTVLGSASVTADSFTNLGYIDIANSFNVTAGADFFNRDSATISADSFNITAVEDFLNGYSATINANDFNVTAGIYFHNTSSATINADNFSVTAGDKFFNFSDSTITANNFNVTVADYFANFVATISADNFNVTAGGDFYNIDSATIDANDFNVTADNFFNTEASVEDGNISADNFSLSVKGDFDYANDFQNNGNIDATALNFQVGGDFSYDDASNDFVWNAQNSLTVLGNASVTADSFINSGNIAVSNSSFDITATDFTNSGTISANTTLNTTVSSTVSDSFNNTGGVVSADTFALSVAGAFDYPKKGTITTNSFNLNVGGDFSNNDASSDFVWGANDTLTVLGSASVVADSFNNRGTIAVSNSSFDITATDLTNAGTISANTTLNTTVSSTVSDSFNNTGGVVSADTFALSVAGNFDYVTDYLDNGTITTNTLNLNVGGDFSNNDLANDFTWGANDSLTVLGTASVVADSFSNSGTIAVSNSSFDITATDFTNSGTISANTTLNTTVSSTANNSFTNTGGVLNADTFALSVAGDFDYVADYLNGTITTNTLNLNVGGDFSNNDASSDFVWGANDTLTVLGSAFATVNSFTNSGYIDIANSFNVTAGYRFYNERGAIINANDFNVTAVDRFYNWYGNATINADNFNVSAGKRFYSWTSTINANSFNVTVEEFYNQKNATLNANNFNVTADNFTNTDGNINADIFSLSVAGDFDYVAEYLGNGTITTNALNLNVGGDFSNNDSANDFVWNANDTLTVLGSAFATVNSFTNSGYIDIANSFNVTAGYRFYNEMGAIINANDFNVTAVDRFYNWYGNATINADNFNVSAGKRFYSWTSTINANSFNLTVEEFYNQKNATLNATNNFNVTADNFTNTDGNINADIFSLSVAGDFDYVAEYLGNGTITTNTLNLNVVGDFSNNDAANDFTWGANDTLTVLGTASVVADSFSNSGTIAVSNSSFDITAASLNNSGTISANTTLNTTLTSTTSNSFTNTGGVLNATAFALSVAGDFDYVAEYLGNGTITTNTINLNVGGNFSNNDANNDFTWGANDTLTVLGSASVVADSFNNSGNINVANSSFDITAASLNNSGTISANSFNATVDSFINEASATITAAECNIVYTTYTDSGTITCLDSVAGDTTIIDIARPDANGLSNNSYETFHIPSNGIVLNNSDSAGTSQLAGSISANTNYNSGDAASLILAQVTGNDISLLFGALEVFGAEAGVIIANPSGITCNACSFINASRVDLVTGSNYNVATDTFDSIANTNIALIDDGFDASSVGILNIQAGSFTNTGGLEANTFNLNVVGNFDYTNRGTITTNALNLNVGGDFSNNDANNDFVWGANDTLTVLGTASVVAASFNNSGTIAVSNSSFDITATDFTNAGTISANTTLNTTLASTANNSFNNTGGVISADTVSLSVAGDFDDTKKGIINANYFNLTAGGSFINDDTNNDFVLAENDSLSISGDFTIATNNYIQSGMVDVDGALDISTMGDFTNNTGGDISADTLAITVGGIIDNDGTITTTSLTIDTDTIHNSGDITANSFLNINATNDVFSGGSIITNALDIEAGRNFANGGTITTNSLEITAGYTVINKGSIASDSLDLTTDDFFRNLTGGEINVASLNITAGGKVTNTATIDVSGILSITANNDSARDDDPAGSFFYVSNRGNITATDLNIAAVDNFYNRGNITTTSSFTTSAKNVFLLNEEIDSFVGTYDGGNISLSGDSSFTADSRIENYGNIDLGSNILDISADSFTNHAGATIDAATLNLDVNSLIQNGFINAVINHQ